jgi:hypothetical protein
MAMARSITETEASSPWARPSVSVGLGADQVADLQLRSDGGVREAGQGAGRLAARQRPSTRRA